MLKIKRVNSLPIPDSENLYEANIIYLVKTDTGFIHMLCTSPTGSLVGKSILPVDIVEQTDVVAAANKDSGLFWYAPSTDDLYIKKLVNGQYSWELVGGKSLQKANNLSDLDDAAAAGAALGLASLAYKDNVTDMDIVNALGYTPADAAVLAGIDTILQSILDPIGTPGGGPM